MQYVNKGKFPFTDPDTGITYEPGDKTDAKASSWLESQEAAGAIIKVQDDKPAEPEKTVPQNTTLITTGSKSAVTPNTPESKPAGRAPDSAGQPTV